MAGVAMELRKAGLCKAEIVLAVGLPFSNFGRDKLKLVDYYSRQRALDFSYEGEDYSVVIAKVIVCPQCYSAIASRLGNMKSDYLIVDIGSKTTEAVYVQNGFPVESKSITIEKAMVKWVKEIQREMKVQTGKDIPEHEVMKVLLKEESNLPAVYTELIHGMMREEIQSQGMKLVGALLAGIGTVSVPAARVETVSKESGLPEVCGELPEELRGVLDLIR